MKLTSNQDIEAPMEHVFAAITDFDGFGRQALRRGAEVVRMDGMNTVGEGMMWQTAFTFRGKRRDMNVELTEYDAPTRVAALSRLKGMTGLLNMELVALSRQRTRLSISLELTPESLPARLLVQSLKLARNGLTKRMNKRLVIFARQTEESYQRSA